MSGGQQVGYAVLNGFYRGSLDRHRCVTREPWTPPDRISRLRTGSPAEGRWARPLSTTTAGRACGAARRPTSWVDLNPAGSTGSVAYGVWGAQQVERQAGVGSVGCAAALWSGTAASFVSLGPAGSHGLDGVRRLGQRAAGGHGLRPRTVPGELVDRDGGVVGGPFASLSARGATAHCKEHLEQRWHDNSNRGLGPQQHHESGMRALLWTRVACGSADFNNDGDTATTNADIGSLLRLLGRELLRPPAVRRTSMGMGIRRRTRISRLSSACSRGELLISLRAGAPSTYTGAVKPDSLEVVRDGSGVEPCGWCEERPTVRAGRVLDQHNEGPTARAGLASASSGRRLTSPRHRRSPSASRSTLDRVEMYVYAGATLTSPLVLEVRPVTAGAWNDDCLRPASRSCRRPLGFNGFHLTWPTRDLSIQASRALAPGAPICAGSFAQGSTTRRARTSSMPLGATSTGPSVGLGCHCRTARPGVSCPQRHSPGSACGSAGLQPRRGHCHRRGHRGLLCVHRPDAAAHRAARRTSTVTGTWRRTPISRRSSARWRSGQLLTSQLASPRRLAPLRLTRHESYPGRVTAAALHGTSSDDRPTGLCPDFLSEFTWRR